MVLEYRIQMYHQILQQWWLGLTALGPDTQNYYKSMVNLAPYARKTVPYLYGKTWRIWWYVLEYNYDSFEYPGPGYHNLSYFLYLNICMHRCLVIGLLIIAS